MYVLTFYVFNKRVHLLVERILMLSKMHGTIIKKNIAYFVNFKCEKDKHYNSNCLLCQPCCLLCASYGEYKAARTCEDLKRGARPGFYLFHSKNSYVSKENSFTKYNTLPYV